MPAIVDPDGPGGRPISVFESGAILQYLGRKTGKFYPADERARVAVDEWLFWQMANLGPKAGEANHFRRYAPEQAALCARPLRQRDEPALRRDEHAAEGPPLPRRRAIRSPTWPASAGSGCSNGRARRLRAFPHLKRWLAAVRARPAVQRGMHVRVEEASKVDVSDPKVRAVLFGQKAR